MDSYEVSKGIYAFLPDDLKRRSILLKPGSMIVHQPACPVPFVAAFPYPLWATRKEEVDDSQQQEDILKVIL